MNKNLDEEYKVYTTTAIFGSNQANITITVYKLGLLVNLKINSFSISSNNSNTNNFIILKPNNFNSDYWPQQSSVGAMIGTGTMIVSSTQIPIIVYTLPTENGLLIQTANASNWALNSVLTLESDIYCNYFSYV